MVPDPSRWCSNRSQRRLENVPMCSIREIWALHLKYIVFTFLEWKIHFVLFLLQVLKIKCVSVLMSFTLIDSISPIMSSIKKSNV